MEKLPMCRICLVENVRMYLVVNRNLQKLYEKLTDIPFVTEDIRPILACFFCCAKLKQCYKLLTQCLEAEELFAQRMTGDCEPSPVIIQDHYGVSSGLIKCPIVHISIVDECQTESIDVKEELPAVCKGLDDVIEPKEEHESDDLEQENLNEYWLDVADIPPRNSESDLEDVDPLIDLKTEEEEVPKKKRRAREMRSGLRNVAFVEEFVPRGGSTRGRVRVRGGSRATLAVASPPTLEPEVAVAVPRGSGSTRRGRGRGRGGSSATSVALGQGEGVVVVPRGGTGRGRGRGGRGRGLYSLAGSDRPGPSTIEELTIYDTEELPVGQPLEVPLHPNRKRRWPPSAPTPQMAAQVVVEEVPPPSPPPPQMAEVVVEDPLPSISPPPSPSVPLPALFLECASSTSLRPRQSLLDDEIYHQLFYGSEPDSGESDEDDVATTTEPCTRAKRSFWDTPLDDADDQPAADNQPAANAPTSALEDASTSSISCVPPSATDQPWGLYEFDWKPFPNVPIPPESRREMFSHNDVGPTTPCVDPYEIFISIWDRQFMEYIASETNRYAQQLKSRLLDGDTLCRNSRMRKWRDTTADELYVYFAVVIAMGVVVKSRIEEYWISTPDVLRTPGFSAHMSGHRFSLLSKCLHFVNNDAMCELNLGASEAKLFKVQPLLSHLNNKFQSLYRLGQNIALDESLLQWKGWLDISQLIPNKAATVGIKTYEICESQTGYLWRFEIHAIGKSRRSPPQQFEDPMKASTPAIVLRLTQGLEGKGHTLWMDNFYNSPCLARRLKVLGFDCVGTLRTNRKFVPQALHSLTKGNMTIGQITGLSSGDVDVMVWKDNNRVAMISTYHGNGVSRARDSSTKPILINDYNIMMGGVDKKDQMLAMFPIERKRTRVWYKKLFRRLLNVSVLNSYIMHRHSSSSSASTSSSLTHRNFRISLINTILSKHRSSPPTFQPATTLSMHQNTQYDVRFHHLAEYPFGAQAKHQRQRRKCANVACRKLVHTYCVGCNKAMCLTTCFVALHQ